MTRRSIRTWLAVVLGGVAGAVLVAAPASGHIGHPLSGAGDGLWHPLTGPDHLLAMVAVGIVAATMHRRLWVAPATFVGGMLLGGVAGLASVPFPGAETLIVASVILLGLTIAGALQDRGPWVLAALAVAGAAHGHAHGAEAPEAANAAAYVGGFVLATVALHLTGVTVGMMVRRRHAVRLGLGLATMTAGGLLLVS